MLISRHPNSANVCKYFLNDTVLSSVDTYMYLGVHISGDLLWKMHVENVASSANRTLRYVGRNFSFAPISLKLTLYKTLVRPKIEYAYAIYNSSQCEFSLTLEATQDPSARFILPNYSRHSSVTAIKNTLNLPDP